MDDNEKPEPLITVFTISWFSSELIKPLFLNLNEKAKFPERIKYVVIDNTAGEDKTLSQIRQIAIPVEIYSNDARKAAGSVGHSLGLNFAMNKIETEFALAVDPDVYVFKNNWDGFCIDEINNKNYSAVGTAYPRWQLGKYHNFPSPVFCFFRAADLKAMGCDWTPFSKNPFVTGCDFVKRQILRCGLLINKKRYQKYPALRSFAMQMENLIGICSRDTGWRIAKKAGESKKTALLFNAVLPDENIPGHQTAAFEKLAGQFELYYYHNEPILTHKYSTSSRIWRTDKGADTDFWLQCIEYFKDALAIHTNAES